jgi:hypothetical protein
MPLMLRLLLVEFKTANVAFISILHGSITLRLAKVIALLALLVNDSEYSQSTGAKPIFRCLLAVFISFPLVR